MFVNAGCIVNCISLKEANLRKLQKLSLDIFLSTLKTVLAFAGRGHCPLSGLFYFICTREKDSNNMTIVLVKVQLCDLFMVILYPDPKHNKPLPFRKTAFQTFPTVTPIMSFI